MKSPIIFTLEEIRATITRPLDCSVHVFKLIWQSVFAEWCGTLQASLVPEDPETVEYKSLLLISSAVFILNVSPSSVALLGKHIKGLGYEDYHPKITGRQLNP